MKNFKTIILKSDHGSVTRGADLYEKFQHYKALTEKIWCFG